MDLYIDNPVHHDILIDGVIIGFVDAVKCKDGRHVLSRPKRHRSSCEQQQKNYHRQDSLPSTKRQTKIT